MTSFLVKRGEKKGLDRPWFSGVRMDGRQNRKIPSESIWVFCTYFKRIRNMYFWASIQYLDGFQDLCACLVRNSGTLVWLFSVCVERKTFLQGRMEREAYHAAEMCSWSEKKGGWWSRHNGLVLSQYSPQPVSKSLEVIYLKGESTHLKFLTTLNILFYLVD